jgi:hypothetical protein
MYACRLTVSGPTSNSWDGPAAAAYLARSVSASGAAYCNSAPSSSSFCGGPQGVTGLCAASPAVATDAPLTCSVAAPPVAVQMAVTLAASGVMCSNASNPASFSNAGAAALAAYVGSLLPGFAVSLPAWSSRAMNCTRAQVRCCQCVLSAESIKSIELCVTRRQLRSSDAYMTCALLL